MTTLLSETFTGTNGANWSAVNWDYKYFQFGGIGDIQSNKGRMVTGSIGSGNDYGTYRSASSFTDFRATFDYTVSGNSTSGSYLAFGFRASSAWITGQMIADACYWVEMTRSASPTFTLKKRVAGVTTTLATTSTTYANNDVIHVKVIANGSSLKVRTWKNAVAQPTTWTFDVVDTAHTAGKFFFSCYGGTNTASETYTLDDLLVDDTLVELTNSPAAGNPLGTGTAYNASVSAVDGASPSLMAETWTGSNGAAWPAQWTTTTSGTGTVADIQSNKGRMATGTAVYGKVGARNTTALASDDYTLTVDVVIPTYTEWYFFVHLRGAGTFTNTFAILSSYQLRFTSYLNAVVAELYEVNGSGATSAPLGAGTVTGTPIAGDTLRIKIEVSGTSSTTLKQKAWIVGAAEPSYTDLSSFVATAYTGDYVALSCQGGNNLVSEDFLWDNFTVTTADDGLVDAQTATGTATAQAPNPSVRGFVNAQLASGHGEGHFDGAGEIQTLTLEALDAVSAHGEAHGAQRQHDAGVATGAGTAYDAGIGGARTATPTAASGVSAAHDPTVIRTGTAEPTAATSTGVANAATTSSTSGSVTATATAATGIGTVAGITYLEDENGEPILDENGDTIGDGAGLTVRVSLASGAATSTGVSNTPTRSVSPSVGVATSVGSAPQPGVNTAGDTSTTNVNPASASSAGVANTASSLVSVSSGAATGAGAAAAPQTTIPASPGAASGTGRAYDWDPASATLAALSVGAAYDAQVNVDGNNFVASAPIPIFASAADPSIAVAVYPAGITVVGVARDANQDNDPGQLITIRDRGHTVTMKER